eukprot:6330628-Alexandrium_andersonii.AAC.1
MGSEKGEGPNAPRVGNCIVQGGARALLQTAAVVAVAPFRGHAERNAHLIGRAACCSIAIGRAKVRPLSYLAGQGLRLSLIHISEPTRLALI